MKVFIGFINIVILLSFSIKSFSQRAQCDSLFVTSLQTFDAQDYNSSLALIYANIETCPAHEKYHLHAAKIYQELYNIPKALSHLSIAIKINDSCVDAYAMRGQIFLEQNFFTQAIENYEKIFMLIPLSHRFDVVYHVNLSKAYNNTQQFQKTYDLLKPMYELAPHNIGLNANLAVSCLNLNKLEEAEYHLLKCVEIDPYFTGGLVNLGYFYSSVNKFDEAITYYNKALALNPREAYALNNRGFAYYSLGNYEHALRDIQESIALLPDNSYAYKNLGLVYLKTGLPTEACTQFNRAIRLGFTEMYGNEVLELLQKNCMESKRSRKRKK